MKLETEPALVDLGVPEASALQPLLWLIVAAVVAVMTLMFAPVPPL